MPRELNEWQARTGGFVPRPGFDTYAEKYSGYFAMRRRDGIIELRMHAHAFLLVDPWRYSPRQLQRLR
jgi:hypothetical protein